jgi:hypothetical protein
VSLSRIAHTSISAARLAKTRFYEKSDVAPRLKLRPRAQMPAGAKVSVAITVLDVTLYTSVVRGRAEKEPYANRERALIFPIVSWIHYEDSWRRCAG